MGLCYSKHKIKSPNETIEKLIILKSLIEKEKSDLHQILMCIKIEIQNLVSLITADDGLSPNLRLINTRNYIEKMDIKKSLERQFNSVQSNIKDMTYQIKLLQELHKSVVLSGG